MKLQTNLLFIATVYSLVTIVLNTEEMTLAIYQYLSNHMTEEECRTLVAALHFRGYKLSNSLDEAESVLPEDVNCLGLLIHWDKTPGEGKAASPEIVIHRLNQIGKKELAVWLQRSLFSEFHDEIELVTQTEKVELATGNLEPQKKSALADWIDDKDFQDNVLIVAVIFVVAIVIAVVVAVFQIIVRVCSQKSIVVVVDESPREISKSTKPPTNKYRKTFRHQEQVKDLEEECSDFEQGIVGEKV